MGKLLPAGGKGVSTRAEIDNPSENGLNEAERDMGKPQLAGKQNNLRFTP